MSWGLRIGIVVVVSTSRQALISMVKTIRGKGKLSASGTLRVAPDSGLDD